MDRIDRPQNQRSRRTRAAALDAAWQLLEEGGAALATMGAVAERAGVSRRALYLHFSSRAELLLALHDHVDQRLGLDASLAPIHEAPDAAAALEAFASHLARYHSQIRSVDLAIVHAMDDDPDLAPLVEHGVQLWLGAARNLAQRLADEERLAPPWTVDTAADLLWSFMFPETLGRLTGDRGWTIDRYEQLLTVLLRRTLTRP